MKKTITLIAIALALGAAAQEELKTIVLKESEIGCIIPPRSIEPVAFVWDADAYYRSQVVPLSYESVVNCFGEPFGSVAIDEDLPFVHTLTGAAYTFDYIRPMAR
jgi:hypothetical protein